MTPAVAAVATRLASKTWGGRWTAAQPEESASPAPGTAQDSRDENDEQRNP
jgi:hypothetical protein